MQERTIAAISTPFGVGGIAVIRVSGADALAITDKIFRGKQKLSEAASHTVHYGHIKDENGNVLDEVLVTVMHAPKTYTRENVAEISTHGGITASKSVLAALIKAGAYPADAGEFTKRAFLNGRIDLSQAEGVIDIINAKTAAEQKNALSQAEGGLSKEINAVREELVRLAAGMQVAIDYPDEDLEDLTTLDIAELIGKNLERVKRLLATADSGRVLKEGIKTAIVGKPNVGKSSLLNCLAREDRAIVTDIAGTTRDVIEEFVNFDGVPMRLLDTAGIHETSDAVEKIGVERSRRAIDEADLVILMLDTSRELDGEDERLLELTAEKKRLIIANKSDIKRAEFDGALAISAKTGEGIDLLCKEIKKLYKLGEIGACDSVIITNMRHAAALEGSRAALKRAYDAITGGLPQDMAALDIYEAIDRLGEITGDTVSESIVSEIFHSFCVGK
ncbi:MAG: tRNA uridine-5-carboxymethylaminomethyl(34) synthesis GTPase MnmE [Clostridia bacterium]|nr:tRNA uridine-5-carboxymethylaminomethyl(34) synthesis GTPase MnmE [Clostridia bacterium]